jgi:uncharacterized protein (TIRG00374 family)
MHFDLARAFRLLAAGVLAFVLVLTAAGLWAGLSDVKAHLARVGADTVLILLGLSTFDYAVRCGRWQMLCRHIGLSLPFGRNALYYLSGLALGMTPGKVGEALRLWLLRRNHGAAYERTAGLFVVDRLTDALPLFAVCLLGAAGFTRWAWTLVPMGLLLVALTWMLVRPGALVLLVKATYGFAGRSPRLFARLIRLLRLLPRFAEPRLLLLWSLIGLIGWLAEIYGVHLLMAALGAPISFAQAAFVFAFALLVGAIPIFPGGVGGTEAVMITLLLALGVELDVAVVATAVTRLVTLVFGTLVGLAALPMALVTPQGSALVPAAQR